jgi:hypothetical protein
MSWWKNIKLRRAPRLLSVRHPSRYFKPALEFLEVRLTPSTYMVTNTSNLASVAHSLPWAVDQADNDRTGTAINIVFASGAGQTFATPQVVHLARTLDLNNTTAGASITIKAPSAGVTIAGGGNSSNFSAVKVEANTKATLNGLTITAGQASRGGAINNVGTLALSSCTLAGNAATFDGGAIYNSGVLAVQGGRIGAPTGGQGDTAGRDGGGIYNSGTLSLAATTFDVDSAQNGGAIFNAASGKLAVKSYVAIYACSCPGDGGALTITAS